MQEALLSRCRGLAVLSMRGCEKTDDSLLKHASIPALRAVDLNGCWRLTDEGIFRLLDGSPGVEKALFGGVWRLSDEAVDAIPTSWPRISTLELTASHHNLTAECMVRLLRACSRLTALRLTTVHFGPGAGGWGDVLGACASHAVRSHLRVVEVEGAPGLTDEELGKYAEACAAADEAAAKEGIVQAAGAAAAAAAGGDCAASSSLPPPPRITLVVKGCIHVSAAAAKTAGAVLA
jgi:hypothetical protein